MEALKLTAIVAIVVTALLVMLIGWKLMTGYRKTILEESPYRKITMLLRQHAQIASESKFRDEIQASVADAYIYVLDLLTSRKDKDMFSPVVKIDLDKHPMLKEEILPYLASLTYHDIEPMDKTLIRLIDHYNNEMDEIMSIFDLLVLVVRNTPPALYGNDRRITQQLYY